MVEMPKFPSKSELQEAIEVVTESLNIVNFQGERGKWNQQALSILNLELKRRKEFVAQLETMLKWYQIDGRIFNYDLQIQLLNDILEAFK